VKWGNGCWIKEEAPSYWGRAGARQGTDAPSSDGGATESAAITGSQFLAYVRLSHPPGDHVKLTVLLGNERLNLTVPMW
jgi:hypothetical protein